MKIKSYAIAGILLFSFSNAANKSITEAGNLQIGDLFYNTDTQSIPAEIEKNNLNQEHKIFEKNEDLELESLEIADIDLATFGEYEAFLNKYYDDNFIDINSRFVKQLEFEMSVALGGRIPFGQNTRPFLNIGSDLGLFISPTSIFYLLNREFKPYMEFNKTFISPKILTEDVTYTLSRYTLGSSLFLTKKIFSRIGFSLNIAKGGFTSNPETKMGFSTNIDLGYNFISIKNLQIGVFARAQTMFNAITNPPIDGDDTGTMETLSFGLQVWSPIYLIY